MTLTPERWQKAREVLHQAMQMDEEERSGFLDSQCASESSLRVELKELLAAEGEIGSNFLEVPALAQAAVRTDTTTGHEVLPPGTKLGPYVVRSLIGAGGMGEVYRAHDAELKRDVAIKVLPASLSRDPDRLRRFQLEAQAAAALNHPNILSIFHIGQQDGSPYIVTELLEGETLRERLRHGALKLRDAVDVAIQTARGLAAAHKKDIAHRDLKPENLFLAKDGRVKVLDFGLAKLMQSATREGPTLSGNNETNAGRVLGTVGYMSPEQVRGELADTRSDIFSLGCVLYEMLTGKRAFRKPTSVETMHAILNEDPPAASEITRGIPPALQRVVHRCLEKSPDRRFQSVSDLAFALDALSETRSFSVSVIGEMTSRQAVAWGAGLLALAMLGVALVAGYKYYPIKKEAPAAQEWEQLTDFSDAVVAPALSPDGKMLTFLRGSHSFLTPGDVYVKLLPKGEPVQLTHQEKLKANPVFSPDGSRIAYTTDPPFDTWVVPALGGQAQLMLPNAAGLTWIDNQHILYSEIKSGMHMAVVTSTEGRAEQHDIYVPPHEEGMAHRSYLSPDRKWVLVAMEMGQIVTSMPCRVVPFDGSSQGRVVGPPGSMCTYGGWSPDGKWMFFSAGTKSGYHLWRQAFPDGEPQQLTFGPTDEDGIAVSPDGRSVLTSVGFHSQTVWVHDRPGERQIPFDGSAWLPNIETSSRATFSPNGKRVYFLGHRNSGVQGGLWAADLVTGQIEGLMPGLGIANSYDISPDGERVIFDSFDSEGHAHLWMAWLDRRSPPRQLESNLLEILPVFGPKGDIFSQAPEGGKFYLYRRLHDGGQPSRITTRPITRLETISPDGKWVVAMIPVEGEQTTRGIVAFNVDDGTTKRICYSLCAVRWSGDGKFLYIGLPGSAVTSAMFKTVIVPLGRGSVFPALPAAGIKSEADFLQVNGVKVVNEIIHPGPDGSRYAFDRIADHRNIYRIPIR